MCLFIYNGHGLCEVTEDGLSEMETKRKVPVSDAAVIGFESL